MPPALSLLQVGGLSWVPFRVPVSGERSGEDWRLWWQNWCGLALLGPVLLLAGLIQLLAGKFVQAGASVSRYVSCRDLRYVGRDRRVDLASQLHVMIDDPLALWY